MDTARRGVVALAAWVAVAIGVPAASGAEIPAGALDPTWGSAGRSTLPHGMVPSGSVAIGGGRVLVVGTNSRDQLETVVLRATGAILAGSRRVDDMHAWTIVDVLSRGGGRGAWVFGRVNIDGVEYDSLARLGADGRRDTSFDNGGFADIFGMSGAAMSIDADATGVVIASHVSKSTTITVSRFEARDDLRLAWATNIDVPFVDAELLRGIDVNDAGEVAIAAGSTVVRLTSTGRPVPTFGAAGVGRLEGDPIGSESSCNHGSSYQARGVDVLGDGRVVVVGALIGHTTCYSGRHPPDTQGGFAAVMRADGSTEQMRHAHPPEYLDPFDIHDIIFAWGRQLDSAFDEVRHVSRGYLIVGHSLQPAGPRVPMLMRLDATGRFDDAFGADGVSIANDVRWGRVSRPRVGEPMVWEGAVRRVVLDGPTDQRTPVLRLARADIDRPLDAAPPTNVAWNGRRAYRWQMRDVEGGVAVELAGSTTRRAFTTRSFHDHGFKESHSACAALRAVDSVGRRTSWVERCLIVPEPHRAVRLSSYARILRSRRFSGGQAYVVRRRRSPIIVRSYNASSTFVIAWTCPRCGSLLIPGFGRTSLRRAGPPRRTLVFVGDVGRSGTRIYTSSRAPVIVDGVVSLDSMSAWPAGA